MRTPSVDPPLDRVLVVGFGVTGRAVTEALARRGSQVIVIDDDPDRALPDDADRGVTGESNPSPARLAELLEWVSVVVPSPGVPDDHPVFAAAQRALVPVISEFDLARRWDDRPIVAVTGTDGKTTVTTLITAMLVAGGRSAVACGNTETPLVVALDDPTTDVFVVEASSFRLAHSQRFTPTIALWLNFAPDHLDAHESLAAYEQAKARIWSDLDPLAGVAIANAVDPVVMAHRPANRRTLTFGPAGTGADATISDGALVMPDGEVLVAIAELPRHHPHDLLNALAAACAAQEMGVDRAAIRSVLVEFTGLAHRVEPVLERDGVLWVDDSKATTPNATRAAVGGFDSVVLIAGGRNKGLDLTALADLVPPVRAVVAIGEAAAEIEQVMGVQVPVRRVGTSMSDAVAAAMSIAQPGDTVLLSPACASFDWYRSYAERGDDFKASVREMTVPISGGRS